MAGLGRPESGAWELVGLGGKIGKTGPGVNMKAESFVKRHIINLELGYESRRDGWPGIKHHHVVQMYTSTIIL